MQSLLKLAFPPRCIGCGALVEEDFKMCGACWRDTPFIAGLVCDLCGVPLPGTDTGAREMCDDCLTIARPWDRGRAAVLYKDGGRRLVLALKHGDRTDLARPLAGWLKACAGPLLDDPTTVLVPVPAHWQRLALRRYNQAAVLARALGQITGHACLADLLRRRRRTPVQDGLGRDARFRNIAGAIEPGARARDRLRGRPVCLIDDVMTSGATLAAATDACLAAGADRVCVLVLARVAKDA